MTWKATTAFRKRNILNLEHAQYPGVGRYDIPQIEPVKEMPPVTEWVPFDKILREKEPENKGLHFFLHDYQFERVWNCPDAYLDKLRRFAVVATPDFSAYGDMPFICQVFNHYRKHWIGAYWQEHGITVIPTIRASTDPLSLEWFLDGEPMGGTVILSAMWTNQKDAEWAAMNRLEYSLMKERLKPSKILIYGKVKGDIGITEDDPVEYIPNYTRARLDRWEEEHGKRQ